jgi:hypothetical protein
MRRKNQQQTCQFFSREKEPHNNFLEVLIKLEIESREIKFFAIIEPPSIDTLNASSNSLIKTIRSKESSKPSAMKSEDEVKSDSGRVS